MKKFMIISALILAVSGTAQAGSEYDNCLKEGKALKAKEADNCGGLSYILNPSACFVTRKSLKEYSAGKCVGIVAAGHVDNNTPKIVLERKGVNSTPPQKQVYSDTPAPPPVRRVSSVTAPEPSKQSGPEVAPREPACDQLKEENSRLKAENSRLKSENEQLKKTGR